MTPEKDKIYFTPAVGTVLYYIAAFLVTYFIYIIEKPQYAHGLNVHLFVAILFFIGGIIWTIKSIGKWFIQGKRFAIAVLINLLVNAGLLIVLNYLIP